MTRLAVFPIVTLTPAALILAATALGGVWVTMALFYLTLLVSLLDGLVQRINPSSEFPSGHGLSIALSLAHFIVLGATVSVLAGSTHTAFEKFGLFFASGLFFGQVSNANAHELIHRSGRLAHQLGKWIYISLLFGHHTSAHVLVHHVHVATQLDPNSARKGEGYYRFAARAWLGSFIAGYAAEAARLQHANRPAYRNPYLLYLGGAGALLIFAYMITGPTGTLAYLALAGYAQAQLLMSDYVQHYGLTRPMAGSRPAPIGAAQSWNSPHWFSSALMLNATRHSDHHMHPGKPYPSLMLAQNSPMLPKPLPLMATIALVPPLWRKTMDPLTERWTGA